jgi:hypothetical protein
MTPSANCLLPICAQFSLQSALLLHGDGQSWLWSASFLPSLGTETNCKNASENRRYVEALAESGFLNHYVFMTDVLRFASVPDSFSLTF